MTSTSNGPSGTTDMHKTGQQTLISFDDGNQASTDEMDVQRALSPDISVDTRMSSHTSLQHREHSNRRFRTRCRRK